MNAERLRSELVYKDSGGIKMSKLQLDAEKIIGYVVGIAIILVVGWIWLDKVVDPLDRRDWQGVIYRYENGEVTDSITNGSQYASPEDCRDWAYNRAKSDNFEEDDWDYKCGKNCQFSGSPGPEIYDFECEEVHTKSSK